MEGQCCWGQAYLAEGLGVMMRCGAFPGALGGGKKELMQDP